MPALKAPMQNASDIEINARGLRIAIVVSRYHPQITQSMCDAARDAFIGAGGDSKRLKIIDSPGTLELTALCRALVLPAKRSAKTLVDAVVALGCVIAGETSHNQYIAQSVTQGLTALTVQTGVPIAFGVLTCQNLEQAEARSIKAATSGRVNKGAEAMMAAIHTVKSIRSIQSSARGKR